MIQQYRPTWHSLRTHPTPQWFRDAKFGIYTHWGIYAVPAFGKNVSWYPYNMYREGTDQYDHHVHTYGHPSQFGYKDFIPEFTGEKFDADEWAELFQKAGARFAGPVAEHHDGFSLWDSALTEWNAARMGPRRDIVGALAAAIRARDMRFMVAVHHAENWWFYPHWRKDFDTSDPHYAGLYGPPHNLDFPDENTEAGVPAWEKQDRPTKEFLEMWKAKLVEIVEKYGPDYIWFDFGLGLVPERYRRDFMAYYYNKGVEWDRGGVVLSYKWDNLPPGTGVVDIELGKMAEQTYYEWITDTTVDDGQGWGYLKDAPYKSVTELVHYLVDNVSKSGSLLLNVGPKPSGEIPQEARNVLLGIGEWLNVNGEAIYGTVPWVRYGEGPTKMTADGAFSDLKEKTHYTAQDIRFTAKDNALYAICLGWPTKEFTIEAAKRLYPGEVQSVRMLGTNRDLMWQMTSAGLVVERPDQKPCDHAFVWKIERG
jgi:alpha-L-fucosidase